jgi:hypothetical protein
MSVGRSDSRTVGLLLLLAVAAIACRGERTPHAFPIPGDAGDRIIVEVLNASGRPGLARAGTRLLRQAGIDVVGFGNALGGGEPPLDSTRILIRRGPASVGERIREALHVGTVLVRPDSTRLLDASVLLGADFRPRAQLHP